MSTNERRLTPPWLSGSTLTVGIGLAIVLFVMVNYLALRHYERFDWTGSQLYTLSEKSENVVRGLDQKIDAIILLSPASELYNAADELLSRYEAANPEYFNKRSLDAARNILEAQQLLEEYGIDRDNVIVLATKNDKRVIDEFELAEYDYSGAQFGQGPTMTEFKGEQKITSAILELVEAEKPKILFTQGHGEAPLDAMGDPRALSQAKTLLGQDNFDLETWDSATGGEVPEGTDLVVVAGPTTNFFPQELAAIGRFLDRGGRLLVLLEPSLEGRPADPGLVAWLAERGVAVGNNVVLDPATDLPFFGPESIYTDRFGTHPIVENLDQTGNRVLLTLARTVGAGETPEGVTVTELVLTSDDAWGETNIKDIDNIAPSDDELQGSLALGVAASWSVAGEESTADGDAGDEEGGDASSGPEARLVVYGDLDFAADSQLMNAANGVLLLNTFNWLVQREQLIEIAGRKPTETRLTMTDSELISVYALVGLFMPGLAVAMGIFVWIRRRR